MRQSTLVYGVILSASQRTRMFHLEYNDFSCDFYATLNSKTQLLQKIPLQQFIFTVRIAANGLYYLDNTVLSRMLRADVLRSFACLRWPRYHTAF
jgi:hypothetical protein